MITIAFVDDEKGILDGLRRMLRGHRKSWDMHFFDDGRDLVEACKSRKFDVVVSDMRMPSLTGSELLAKIKTVSPETLRIALSGYSNEEMTLESLHATHQYIAKPADPTKIADTIKRAMRLQDAIRPGSVRAKLGAIEALPVLPIIYDELMAEIASGNSSIERIGKIIGKDLALSSGLLKIVNSAFFSLARHVESPEQAAAILGVETIKNIALSTSVLSAFKTDKKTLEKMSQINTHSQKLGLLVSKLARPCKALSARAKDHAQIGAMMSCIGELFTLCYGDTLPQAVDDSLDSPSLGSYLLAFWGMPFPVIEAVKWHQHPEKSEIEQITPLTLVHAGWSMLSSCSENGRVDWDHKLIADHYLKSIVNQEELDQWAQITEDFCLGTKETND